MTAHSHSVRGALALAGCAVLLTACDDEALRPVPPPPDATAGALFNSYVAIGNSITAGFQSGGISDSTQREAYPGLLARQMGTTFNLPLLNAPGCPPPFINVFTQQRTAPIPCALRERPLPEIIHNVAVPGAAVIDALSNLDSASGPNALTTFFLGGRTQIDAAAAARPSFVTVWIGNNDVLGSITRGDALTGDPSTITPVADFAGRYGDLADEIDDLGPQGGVLIGVVQVGFAPFLTSGLAWAGFEQAFDAQTAPLNALDVAPSCVTPEPIPTTTNAVFGAVPFPVGGGLLQQAVAKIDSVLNGLLPPPSLVPVVVDCDRPEMVDRVEMLNLFLTVVQYNAVIEAAAADLGFVFVDPNGLLLELLSDPSAIRPFPAFPGTADPAITVTAPFGTALSRDGIHPSVAAHRLVANALIQAINARYGTAIPPLQP